MCGLAAGIFIVFVLALPGIAAGCLVLFAGSKETRKYGFLILFLAVFSSGYSYLYDFLLGGYFNMWEFIHVCGACALTGYGILLFINSREIKKSIYTEDDLYKIIKTTITAGIILFIFGIWWIIIIVYYYARFLYWPLFWLITWLSCACCLGAGVFSFLLAQQMKKIVPMLVSSMKSTLFPVFRYILCNRIPGYIIIVLGFICIIYQTGLFPLLGF